MERGGEDFRGERRLSDVRKAIRAESRSIRPQWIIAGLLWWRPFMAEGVDRIRTHRPPNAWLGFAPLLFAREMLSRPSAVGAIWPSSRRLASSVASGVPVHGDGLVVELGGGTGAVTYALLQRGITPGRLMVIERSAAFVRHLRAQFPGVAIVQGDAAELGALLPGGRPVDAIISSLPLRSLPARQAAAVVAQWRALIADHGIVVQFTYDLRGTGSRPLSGFLQRTSHIVWANFPPARVLTLVCRGTDRIPGSSRERRNPSFAGRRSNRGVT